ncbi:MAG: hypothetical protein ACOCPQ_01485 [Desulfosudaceae bacterium]
MKGFALSYYGYGTAGIPMPLPALNESLLTRRFFLGHPTFYGLLSALLVIGMIRSCVMPVTRPSRTVLWLHHIPETEVVKPSPRTVAREPEARKQPESPERPELMPLRKARPKPRVLEAPRQLPLAERPVLPDIKASQPDLDRKVLRRADRAVPAPTAKPEALAARRNETTRRMMTQPDNSPAITPTPAPSRTVAAADRDTYRTSAGRPAARDFTPLSSSSSTVKPVQSSSTSKQRRSSTVLKSDAPTVADAPRQAARRPEAAAAGRTPSADGQAGSGPGDDFSPDLPSASASPRVTGRQSGLAQGVSITGLVEGESSRVANLKRLISQKARKMSPGAYCCRINNIECRLTVATDKTVAITFSRDEIAFEIVSRLERRMPERVQPCVD